MTGLSPSVHPFMCSIIYISKSKKHSYLFSFSFSLLFLLEETIVCVGDMVVDMCDYHHVMYYEI